MTPKEDGHGSSYELNFGQVGVDKPPRCHPYSPSRADKQPVLNSVRSSPHIVWETPVSSSPSVDNSKRHAGTKQGNNQSIFTLQHRMTLPHNFSHTVETSKRHRSASSKQENEIPAAAVPPEAEEIPEREPRSRNSPRKRRSKSAGCQKKDGQDRAKRTARSGTMGCRVRSGGSESPPEATISSGCEEAVQNIIHSARPELNRVPNKSNKQRNEIGANVKQPNKEVNRSLPPRPQTSRNDTDPVVLRLPDSCFSRTLSSEYLSNQSVIVTQKRHLARQSPKGRQKGISDDRYGKSVSHPLSEGSSTDIYHSDYRQSSSITKHLDVRIVQSSFTGIEGNTVLDSPPQVDQPFEILDDSGSQSHSGQKNSSRKSARRHGHGESDPGLMPYNPYLPLISPASFGDRDSNNASSGLYVSSATPISSPDRISSSKCANTSSTPDAYCVTPTSNSGLSFAYTDSGSSDSSQDGRIVLSRRDLDVLASKHKRLILMRSVTSKGKQKRLHLSLSSLFDVNSNSSRSLRQLSLDLPQPAQGTKSSPASSPVSHTQSIVFDKHAGKKIDEKFTTLGSVLPETGKSPVSWKHHLVYRPRGYINTSDVELRDTLNSSVRHVTPRRGVDPFSVLAASSNDSQLSYYKRLSLMFLDNWFCPEVIASITQNSSVDPYPLSNGSSSSSLTTYTSCPSSVYPYSPQTTPPSSGNNKEDSKTLAAMRKVRLINKKTKSNDSRSPNDLDPRDVLNGEVSGRSIIEDVYFNNSITTTKFPISESPNINKQSSTLSRFSSSLKSFGARTSMFRRDSFMVDDTDVKELPPSNAPNPWLFPFLSVSYSVPPFILTASKVKPAQIGQASKTYRDKQRSRGRKGRRTLMKSSSSFWRSLLGPSLRLLTDASSTASRWMELEFSGDEKDYRTPKMISPRRGVPYNLDLSVTEHANAVDLRGLSGKSVGNKTSLVDKMSLEGAVGSIDVSAGQQRMEALTWAVMDDGLICEWNKVSSAATVRELKTESQDKTLAVDERLWWHDEKLDGCKEARALLFGQDAEDTFFSDQDSSEDSDLYMRLVLRGSLTQALTELSSKRTQKLILKRCNSRNKKICRTSLSVDNPSSSPSPSSSEPETETGKSDVLRWESRLSHPSDLLSRNLVAGRRDAIRTLKYAAGAGTLLAIQTDSLLKKQKKIKGDSVTRTSDEAVWSKLLENGLIRSRVQFPPSSSHSGQESEDGRRGIGDSLSSIKSCRPEIKIHDLNDKKKEIWIIMMFGGKDMLALDWLPFISRFYHYAIDRRTTDAIHRLKQRSTQNISNHIKLSRKIAAGETLTPDEMEMAAALRDNFVENSGTMLLRRVDEISNKPQIKCAIHANAVLVEMPGFGFSGGTPCPETCIAAAVNTFNTVVRKLMAYNDVGTINIQLVGYSLGAGIALKLAEKMAVSSSRHQLSSTDGYSLNPTTSTLKFSPTPGLAEIETAWRHDPIPRHGSDGASAADSTADEEGVTDGVVPRIQRRLSIRGTPSSLSSTVTDRSPSGTAGSVRSGLTQLSSISDATCPKDKYFASTKRASFHIPQEDSGREYRDKRKKTLSSKCKTAKSKLVLRSLVLVAPFTNMSECAANLLRIPDTFKNAASNLLSKFETSTIAWNNVEAIESFADAVTANLKSFSDFKLIICHGTNDTMIPPSMSKKLASVFRSKIESAGLRAEKSLNTEASKICKTVSDRIECVMISGATHQSVVLSPSSQNVIHRLMYDVGMVEEYVTKKMKANK